MPDSAAPAAAPAVPPVEAPPEWKPEPRQWSWKDLFTAPMLAFKPKCMLISGLTAVILGLWVALLMAPLGSRGALFDSLANSSDSRVWLCAVMWFWATVGAVIFSIGASFVAVFMKADLLDDEFLTYREAWSLFQDRLVPAVLVPLFLSLLVTGVWLAIWFGGLVSSVPYLGSFLYALIGYPLAILACVFWLLVASATVLSLFLFPGIIATRRHGWFDNVVDTIEAVGTKPHQLVAALLLSGAIIAAAYGLGHGALSQMTNVTQSLPHLDGGNQVTQIDQVATTLRVDWLEWIDPASRRRSQEADYVYVYRDMLVNGQVYSTYTRIAGTVVAGWQTLIVVLLLGYCLNLLVAGGMLTYLWVREDDYWDDEDLQDLDQLAKELEDEAQRATAEAQANTPAANPVAPA